MPEIIRRGKKNMKKKRGLASCSFVLFNAINYKLCYPLKITLRSPLFSFFFTSYQSSEKNVSELKKKRDFGWLVNVCMCMCMYIYIC